MERYKEGRAKYFSAIADDTRSGGDNLLFRRSELDFREDIFTRRGCTAGSGCPERLSDHHGQKVLRLGWTKLRPPSSSVCDGPAWSRALSRHL